MAVEFVRTIGSGTCDGATEEAKVDGVAGANSYGAKKKAVCVNRNRSYNSEKKLYFSQAD
jgi:hypothetical protein